MTFFNIKRSPSAGPQVEPTNFEGGTLEMKGWLHKQGCRYKTWNKRWFILKGPNLFYFKNPKNVRMKGVINLRGYRIISDESIQPGKYSFKAQHEQERTFYFYTDHEESAKSWMISLMKSTISRDYTYPVLSSRIIPAVSLDVARRMRPRPPSVMLYEKQEELNQDSGFISNLPIAESEDEVPEDILGWLNKICQSSLKSIKDLEPDLWIKLLQTITGKKISATTDKIASIFEFMVSENIIKKESNIQDIYQKNEPQMILILQSVFEWSL